jgi:hypothetical protein
LCEEKKVKEKVRRARSASLYGFEGATSRNGDGRARDPGNSWWRRESIKAKGVVKLLSLESREACSPSPYPKSDEKKLMQMWYGAH